MLKSDQLATVSDQLKKLKITLSFDDLLRKPQGQVLLEAVFEDDWEKNELFKKIDHLVNKALSRKAKAVSFKGKKDEVLTVADSSFSYEEVVVFGLGKRREFQLHRLERYLAQVLRAAAQRKLTSAAFWVDQTFGQSLFELGKSLSEAYHLSQYCFDQYKSEEEKKKIKRVEILNIYLNSKQFTDQFKKGLEFGRIVAQGVYLVRNLVNEPSAHVHPATLAQVARDIGANSQGLIAVEVLNADDCHKLGMGAFLGVAQGSDHKPKFIILKMQNPPIRRAGQNTKRKKICLIGKSITFDSGGLSLKPADSMETMKIDMAGGATVLGLFQTLSHLEKQGLVNINFDLYGLLPACENMPSGKALRPGDILKALNGKTIEVLNTDAEGRLALADGLSYAVRYLKPDYMIDLATLTGAVMVALGEEITGLFGNHQGFTDAVLKAARLEGEEIWPLPLFQDYLEKMKSETADLKNVSAARYGGAITAALFLQEFVPADRNWVHLDIAGSSYNENQPKSVLSKGATGWGVKTLTRLLTALRG